MLNFSYYLHERAEESRHNEAMSLSIAIIGSIFLIGGILLTLITTQSIQWLLVIPYSDGSSAQMIWSLGLTLIGAILFLAGIILAVHYAAQRMWYSSSLKEVYRYEEEKMKLQGKIEVELQASTLSRATEPTVDKVPSDTAASLPQFEKTPEQKT